MNIPNAPDPPTGLMRWLFRAPIYLYHWNLGWLMGNRFLLLHHIGRISGLPRQAVVEVVRHDAESDTYIIASGFGEKAQWYQNLLSQPDVRIQVGRREMMVRAEKLPQEQAAEELRRYGSAHPQAARTLGRFLGLDWDGTPEQAPEIAEIIPIIALRPRG